MRFEDTLDRSRINAREIDAFDLFSFRHYVGLNPYLDAAALVFDFAVTGNLQPLPMDRYLSELSLYYPLLIQESYPSYAHLFGRLAAQLNQLDMDLDLGGWRLRFYPNYTRIALQTLHGRTTRAAVYLAWDWLEAITQGQPFDLAGRMRQLQERFRLSAYGGPTAYALLRSAREQGIPTFLIWEEGLIQYGYGRKQVRGIATTFDCDSNVDSAFTTRKDDCKIFLAARGFPVPQGEVVGSLGEGLQVAATIGYPVVIKPVAGHKGMGVTANVQTPDALEQAFIRALEAIPEEQPLEVIVEQHLMGTDFRLLCVGGRFVAAVERRPASVVGDGRSTIARLVERENASPARLDTPTSPLGPILVDAAMQDYLVEQGLSLESVPDAGQQVFLRKIANLSAGGVSRDVTSEVHIDNIRLVEDVAQHLRLVCLGIDVIAPTLSRSWKEGGLGIIEINAAPGVYMHLRPAVGKSVDVPGFILRAFFANGSASRIPIVTFNKLPLAEARALVERILAHRPGSMVGVACREGVLLNQAEWVRHPRHNRNLENLLRHPRLDFLIAEYDAIDLEREGLFYEGSDLVVLQDPDPVELLLERALPLPGATVILKQEKLVTVRSRGWTEQYELGPEDLLSALYLPQIERLLSDPDLLLKNGIQLGS